MPRKRSHQHTYASNRHARVAATLSAGLQLRVVVREHGRHVVQVQPFDGVEAEALVREAVAIVDREMSAIRNAGKVKARERMAVLAALNLAYQRADGRTGGHRHDLQPDGEAAHAAGPALPAAMPQRSSAASSLTRASTQRAPCGVCSFFQNGACVFR